MKAYWDSSALIEALHDQKIRSRIKAGEGATRTHSLSELFSTLTKGVNYRYSPDDAANMVEDLARDLTFVDLSELETRATIKTAGSQGVRGARIHDLMHAAAATKIKADVLLTLDKSGFDTLKIPVRVEAP
jgi:predicted nucleic acid-binding protein